MAQTYPIETHYQKKWFCYMGFVNLTNGYLFSISKRKLFTFENTNKNYPSPHGKEAELLWSCWREMEKTWEEGNDVVVVRLINKTMELIMLWVVVGDMEWVSFPYHSSKKEASK
jgi:hypothetical protein